ncbi:MAG: response regulator transcription factor [Dehalococcoidia bacterium]|nr:response regulator transcription factor [Dehalococcoidia bacterium]
MTLDARPAPVAGRLQYRVLVASARRELRTDLAALLTEAAFSVTMVHEPEDLDERIRLAVPDVILVDEPDGDCRCLERVRRATTAPIVAIVPASDAAAALRALECGATDCVCIPSDLGADPSARAELVWRPLAALSRSSRDSDLLATLIGPSGIVMRQHAHEISVHGLAIDLTPREFAVLRYLLEHRGEVVSADNVALASWGSAERGARNLVQAYLSRIRVKLSQAGAPNVVTTVRGVGYVIR